MNAALCELLDNPKYSPRFIRPERMGPALTFAVHMGLVIEAISARFTADWAFRVEMASHFARLNDGIEEAIVQRSQDLKRPDSDMQFSIEKWSSLMTPATVQAQLHSLRCRGCIVHNQQLPHTPTSSNRAQTALARAHAGAASDGHRRW